MVTNDQPEVAVVGAVSTLDGARTIVWLWGEHDLASAVRLTGFLADAAEDGTDLVVDLSAVSFMDASTISAIVRARAAMAERVRVLTVRSPSALMERVFGFCGLDDLIESAQAPPPGWSERSCSALESWVAVAPRDPAPSPETRPALEEIRRASRE